MWIAILLMMFNVTFKPLKILDDKPYRSRREER
jgi:hypothetical protein